MKFFCIKEGGEKNLRTNLTVLYSDTHLKDSKQQQMKRTTCLNCSHIMSILTSRQMEEVCKRIWRETCKYAAKHVFYVCTSVYTHLARGQPVCSKQPTFLKWGSARGFTYVHSYTSGFKQHMIFIMQGRLLHG